jgi:hypothetical protein
MMRRKTGDRTISPNKAQIKSATLFTTLWHLPMASWLYERLKALSG